jgi:hypothetical protein
VRTVLVTVNSMLIALAFLVMAWPAAVAGADEPTGLCGRCGDGYCAAQCGETATSCPKDCGGSVESLACADSRCGKCGDGYCAAQCGETATSCPRDCGWSY